MKLTVKKTFVWEFSEDDALLISNAIGNFIVDHQPVPDDCRWKELIEANKTFNREFNSRD